MSPSEANWSVCYDSRSSLCSVSLSAGRRAEVLEQDGSGDDWNATEGVQYKQIVIAGDNKRCVTVYGQFQDSIIFGITTSLGLSRLISTNSDSRTNASRKFSRSSIVT